MLPECPPKYTCTFDPVAPPEHHWIGPWYETGWGIAVSVFIVLAVCLLFAWLASLWFQNRREKRELTERERERTHKLALEEQRTMQLDAAKGDPEMLKIVRGR